MIRWEETMTCSSCGKPFKHTFNDAVTPKDLEFRRKPLCNRCQKKSALFNQFNHKNNIKKER